MTFGLDIRHAGSSCPYLDRRSRS